VRVSSPRDEEQPIGRIPVLTSVTLRYLRDAEGLRRLDASRRDDGGILIEGQDLGPGVEQVWGEGLTEYEWAWSLAPEPSWRRSRRWAARTGRSTRAIGVWYAANGGLDPGIRLREAGVPVEFWSRVGD
jgi:hypothetical protein